MATAYQERNSVDNYSEDDNSDHLSKGDVDWHPNSWDFMQLWDGLEYPMKQLNQPGKMVKEVRDQTEYIEIEKELYLLREGELVNAFEENDGEYETIDEPTYNWENVENAEIDELSQSKLSCLTDCTQRSISNLETRHNYSKVADEGERTEAQVSKALNIPNYHKIQHIENYNGKTKGNILKNLREQDCESDEILKLEDIDECYFNAIRDLFGSWNKAKRLADLEVIEYGQGGRKYDLPDNMNLFNPIDSEQGAWALGLLYGDGNVALEDQKNKNRIALSLNIEDINTVNQFRNSLESENLIKRMPKEKENTSDQALFYAFSEGIRNDLAKWGVVPDKTHELEWVNDYESKPHELPEEFMSDFIRGLMDADGSISHSNQQLSFSIKGTKDVATGVRNEINSHLNTEGSIKNERVVFGGNEQVPKIVDWLYPNPEEDDNWESVPFMSRKLEEFVNFEPDYKNENLEKIQEKLEPVLEHKKGEEAPIEDILE